MSDDDPKADRMLSRVSLVFAVAAIPCVGADAAPIGASVVHVLDPARGVDDQSSAKEAGQRKEGYAPAAQLQPKPVPPAIKPVRFTEDYSYLRDPTTRTGAWWEPLKYLPLNADGTAYLTLGAEARLRYEKNFDNGIAYPEQPTQGYLWTRLMPYADLHLGRLRGFAQLNVAHADRTSVSRGPIDETGVDLSQAFVDVGFPVGSSGSALAFRGGRQGMVYGSERLISYRYGPNVVRTFDGGLVRWERRDWRIDAFAVRPVRNRCGDFDDDSHPQDHMWSLYATRKLPSVGEDAGLDAYYIGSHKGSVELNQGEGESRRHTLGTRFFGTASGWTWDVEAFYQSGRFGGNTTISAWSVATDISYAFARLPLKPTVGLRANIASGDGDPADDRLGTFDPLYPKGAYFGEIGLIGPVNLINLHPNASFELSSVLTLSTAAVFFWRESLGDGIYGISGNLMLPDGGSRARYIGTQGEVLLEWQVDRNLSFSASYSLFKPGEFVRDTGQADIVHFIGLEAMHRF